MKSRLTVLRITGIVTLLFFFSNIYSTIIYVDINAPGTNSGGSWTNAYTSLQTGLGDAVSGDTIVVAKGIYTPHTSDRSVYFVLKQGVVLLGGFEGNESEFTQAILDARNFSVNETVLSGDLNANDDGFSNNSENSYHVIFSECLSSSVTSSTVIDGFTISGGNANRYAFNDYDDLRGGGIFLEANAPYTCSPTFKNVIVENNSAQFGGGISIQSYNNGAYCSPVFENFMVRHNRTFESDDTQLSAGGGIFINTVDGISSPDFTNGEILGNIVVEGTVAGTGGGVDISASIFVSTSESSPTFTDVLFCGNLASGGGAHLHTYAQSGGSTLMPEFINVTMAGGVNNYPIYNRNTGIFSSVNQPNFINTLVFTDFSTSVYNSPAPSVLGPNPAFSYSNIRGSHLSDTWKTGYGVDNGNNMDEVSFMFDTSMCNVDLYDNSPEIGAGNNTYGNNIGYYQGSGLIDLVLQQAVNYNSCGGDTLFTFKLGVQDESSDSAEYIFYLGNGDLILSNITDTLLNDSIHLIINIDSTWYGKDTLSIGISNLVGEYDTTSFEFSIAKKPILNDYDLGVFNTVDTTYSVILYPDTSLTSPVYSIDGVVTGNNYFAGLEPGIHYGLIEKSGCYSDSLEIILEEYINDLELTIVPFDDTTRFNLCHGDTTLFLEFKFVDDNLEHVEWFFNYHYLKIIPDSNITRGETDSSYFFEVIVPDTVGYYNLHVHAENIYMEMANLYFQIYIVEPPVVDTVVVVDYGYDTCAYPSVIFNYIHQLKVWINDIDVTQTQMTCGLSAGEHFAIAYSDGCPSEIYEFTIEAYVDTTTTDPGGGTSISVFEDTPMKIYPVPANTFIYVDGIEKGSMLEVHDLTGKIRVQKQIKESGEPIDVSELQPGYYILRLTTKNKGVISRKLLIE